MTTEPAATGEPAASAAGAGIADQRRGQMLTAALDVISERGFADTRIADVAERIGISPALVIYYFKTKDQLLTEAITHYEDAWYAKGKHRMDALPTSARRIEEFVAMNLLPDSDPELDSNWKLWLDSGYRRRGTPMSPCFTTNLMSAGARRLSRSFALVRQPESSLTSIPIRFRSSSQRY